MFGRGRRTGNGLVEKDGSAEGNGGSAGAAACTGAVGAAVEGIGIEKFTRCAYTADAKNTTPA